MKESKLINIGRTAEVYEYPQNRILKYYRANFPKFMIEHEFKINKSLANIGLPIPECYNIVQIDNRYGIIFEKLNGKSMLNILTSRIWNIPKYAKKAAEIHYKIQKEISSELIDNKAKLKENIANADLLRKDTKKIIYDYIDSLPNGNNLCHGDFHPDNIIITNKASYVIDWMTATKGNPHSDIARTSILFKYGQLPKEKSSLEKAITKLIRKYFYNIYIEHYTKLSGTNLSDIEKWQLPHMAARLIEWIPKEEKEILLIEINRKIRDLKI